MTRLKGTALHRHVATVERGAIDSARLTLMPNGWPEHPLPPEHVYYRRAFDAVSDLTGIVHYIATMEGKP